MGIDTKVMLKGFVSAEDITKFLSRKYSDVKNCVNEESCRAISELERFGGE